MKTVIAILLLLAVLVWLLLGSVFLGLAEPSLIPAQAMKLTRPESFAEFGDSFGVLNALLSPIALILALTSILISSKHQADSNIIGGFASRQNFLLTECARLEVDIQKLKNSGKLDKELFDNMVSKRQRYFQEVNEIDLTLKHLLDSFKKNRPY